MLFLIPLHCSHRENPPFSVQGHFHWNAISTLLSPCALEPRRASCRAAIPQQRPLPHRWIFQGQGSWDQRIQWIPEPNKQLGTSRDPPAQTLRSVLWHYPGNAAWSLPFLKVNRECFYQLHKHTEKKKKHLVRDVADLHFFSSFREKLLTLWKIACLLKLCYTTTLLRKFHISGMSACNLRTLKLSSPRKAKPNNNLYCKSFSCQSPLKKKSKTPTKNNKKKPKSPKQNLQVLSKC